MHTEQMPIEDVPTRALPADSFPLIDEPTRHYTPDALPPAVWERAVSPDRSASVAWERAVSPDPAPMIADEPTLRDDISGEPTQQSNTPARRPSLHSRRRFLRFGAMAAGATVVGGAGVVAARHLSHQPDNTLAHGIELSVMGQPVFEETGPFPSGGQYLSRTYDSRMTFGALGSYWDASAGNPATVVTELRTSVDGTTWTGWQVQAGQPKESKVLPTATNRVYGALLLRGGRYMQFRTTIPTGVSLSRVGLSPIAPIVGPAPAQRPSLDENAFSLVSAPYVISRAGWGANESWRFSNGVEVWPVEYRTPLVMIVHHSETENVYNADPSVDVRGIYYYHAITKGWGDIGYNYLVDWKGNIYEGRYGGDGVVGGHAYQYNYGSIGICLIGSFKTVQPTQAQLNALIHLLAWKASVKNIDPLAKRYFVDRANVACISGHRDVIDTTCPGDAAYGDLPTIRQQVASALAANAAPPVTLTSVTFAPTTVAGGQTVRVDATVKNAGTTTLHSQGPTPGFTYTEGQDFIAAGFPKQQDSYRVAVDFANNKGTSHPYRWGLGRDLAPGESVTVTGYIKLTSTQVQNYWGGLVQEYKRYVDDNKGVTPISCVKSLPTLPALSQASANTWYFPETGHNLGGTFLTYWVKNGGLAIYGFPVTEEFIEISPTDNKPYTVQYFERARFERHPENAGTQFEVLLGLLGSQITAGRSAEAPFVRVASVANTASRTWFGQTGHTLNNLFKTYWEQHGGLAQFGYPLCEEFREKNAEDGQTYTVQYFERARFEYHPDAPAAYQVMLGMLGKQVLRARGWL